MKNRLKKNICNLDDYAVLNRVKDLPLHRRGHIGDSLEYACCFWTRHLMETPTHGDEVEEVQKAIEEFFTRHLLFWIEVLIIIGSLDVSVYAINEIRQWYILVSFEWFMC